MRQHLDSIYEAALGHGPGRRNVRLGYKVSKNAPNQKVCTGRGRNELLL